MLMILYMLNLVQNDGQSLDSIYNTDWWVYLANLDDDLS